MNLSDPLLEPVLLYESSPPDDSDKVLRDFLHEMAELDRQETPKTPETRFLKRKAVDTPVRAKKMKKTFSKPNKEGPIVKPNQFPYEVVTDKVPITRWQRRKQSVEALKEQAQALSKYVAFLEARRALEQSNESVILSLGAEQQAPTEAGYWQAAALREMRRCLSSQEENIKLKKRLQACVQASDKLQTALYVANAICTELNH